MNEQDPMEMFTAAAIHAEQMVREAYLAIAMVCAAYEATDPGLDVDGQTETIASAVAMVKAAQELSDALWTAVEATRENAEVGR